MPAPLSMRVRSVGRGACAGAQSSRRRESCAGATPANSAPAGSRCLHPASAASPRCPMRGPRCLRRPCLPRRRRPWRGWAARLGIAALEPVCGERLEVAAGADAYRRSAGCTPDRLNVLPLGRPGLPSNMMHSNKLSTETPRPYPDPRLVCRRKRWPCASRRTTGAAGTSSGADYSTSRADQEQFVKSLRHKKIQRHPPAPIPTPQPHLPNSRIFRWSLTAS